MNTEELDIDPTVSVIHRMVAATTCGEVAGFADLVQQRSLDHLLVDIHGFALLSDAKFNLAKQILRKRLRALPPAEREQFRAFAEESCERDNVALERIANIFAVD